MNEDGFEAFANAIREQYEERWRTQRTDSLFTSEYAMEVPRDTIYYIKPAFSDKVTMSFSFKPKYKRVCKI